MAYVSSSTRDVLVHSYLHFVAISLLYYDHLLTLRKEIQFIWLRSKTLSSYCFLVNRYLAFFTNIAVSAMTFSTLGPHTCRTYSISRQLLLVVTQVFVGILLGARIYALYGRSTRLLAFLFAFSSVMLALSIWSLLGQKAEASTQVRGCNIALSDGTGRRLATAWEALFIFDTLLFILTIHKTLLARKQHHLRFTRSSMPLLSLILRDGAVYFAVMALANLANIFTFYFTSPLLKGSLSTFASLVSVTMMSRLMLNLHESVEVGILSTSPAADSSLPYEAGLITTVYLDEEDFMVLPSPAESEDDLDIRGSIGAS